MTIVLVDGSNVAKSRGWRRVVEEERREVEAHMAMLLPVRDHDLGGRLLDWILYWSHQHGHEPYVVFDGEGPVGAGAQEWGPGYWVEGSGGATDGDTVVERVAARLGREGTVFWLVTNDVDLRSVAGANAERVINVEDFISEITTMPELEPGVTHGFDAGPEQSRRIVDILDDDQRERWERMRRGEDA